MLYVGHTYQSTKVKKVLQVFQTRGSILFESTIYRFDDET